jgi:hypothetical protein
MPERQPYTQYSAGSAFRQLSLDSLAADHICSRAKLETEFVNNATLLKKMGM